MEGALERVSFQGVQRGGGVESGDAFGSEHQLDTVEVESVAHGDAGVCAALVEDLGRGPHVLIRGLALRLRDDLCPGRAALDQVVAAHAAFRKAGVAACTARGDDQRSEAALFQFEGVVEAGFEDG